MAVNLFEGHNAERLAHSLETIANHLNFVGNDNAIQQKVTAWLSQNITAIGNPPLDRSLSSNVSAAPSDIVGVMQKESENFQAGIEAAVGVSTVAFETGYYTTPADGENVSKLTPDGWVTAHFAVTAGDKVTMNVTATDEASRAYVFINNNGKAIGQCEANLSGKRTVTVPTGAVYIAVNNRLESQPNGYYAYIGIPVALKQPKHVFLTQSSVGGRSGGSTQLYVYICETEEELVLNPGDFIYVKFGDTYTYRSTATYHIGTRIAGEDDYVSYYINNLDTYDAGINLFKQNHVYQFYYNGTNLQIINFDPT